MKTSRIRIVLALFLLLGAVTAPGCVTTQLWGLDRSKYEHVDHREAHVQASLQADEDGTFVYRSAGRPVRCHPHLIYGEEAVALLGRPDVFEVRDTEVGISFTEIDGVDTGCNGRIQIDGRWLPGWRTVVPATDVPPAAFEALQQDDRPHEGLETALWQLGQVLPRARGELWTPRSSEAARVAAFVVVDEAGRLAPQGVAPMERGPNLTFTARERFYAPWTVYLRVVDGERTEYVRTSPSNLWLVSITRMHEGHARYRTNFIEQRATDATAAQPAGAPVLARARERHSRLQTPAPGFAVRAGQVALTPFAVLLDGALFVPTRVLLLFADWS